jgi:NADH dehydrogenase [ubiquinone] 1 alpha subcomplex assembly factor 5
LSILLIIGTSAKMPSASDIVPEIFDRNARLLRRSRTDGRGFFAETMGADLLDRLDSVQRKFSNALVIGHRPILNEGLTERGIAYVTYAGDEDRMADNAAAYDLILSTGTLDTVADLPGALLLMRRALVPDGLLLANFAGAPSLIALRSAMAAVDSEVATAIARLHPQVDVRSAGDLLVRAGLALPVADLDTMNIAYSSLSRLLTDLREAGATNVLAQRHPVSRSWLAAVDSAFTALADPDGRTHETLSYITLTAWCPAPTQPQPARRGSGSTSLADALRRRDDRRDQG